LWPALWARGAPSGWPPGAALALDASNRWGFITNATLPAPPLHDLQRMATFLLDDSPAYRDSKFGALVVTGGERSALLTASTTTIAGIVLGAILTWFASRWFRDTWLFRRAVLSAAVDGAHGAPIRGEPTPPPSGTRGVADSDLRPSGRARFGETVFDAQSTGAYIARGSAIEVVGRMGQTIVVEESSHDAAREPSGAAGGMPA
jgi:membrane protein implicated in regulation of membrane protease activity